MRGGVVTVLANIVFWSFFLTRMWILFFNPMYDIFQEQSMSDLTMTSPVIESPDYQSFPVIEVEQNGRNVADQYDIFIQRNFYEIED
jgi:hypothetical protein